MKRLFAILLACILVGCQPVPEPEPQLDPFVVVIEACHAFIEHYGDVSKFDFNVFQVADGVIALPLELEGKKDVQVSDYPAGLFERVTTLEELKGPGQFYLSLSLVHIDVSYNGKRLFVAWEE